MILYHGSLEAIEKPDISFSRINTDFGKGFYTTSIESQAEKWATRFKRRFGYATVSIYNDDVFNTLAIFFRGYIDKEEAIKRLRYEKPNIQYCFKNQEVINKYLQFAGAERL
jgi:hypothetical protein